MTETMLRSEAMAEILNESDRRRRDIESLQSEIHIFTRLLLAPPRQHFVLSRKMLSKLISVLPFDYKSKSVPVYARVGFSRCNATVSPVQNPRRFGTQRICVCENVIGHL